MNTRERQAEVDLERHPIIIAIAVLIAVTAVCAIVLGPFFIPAGMLILNDDWHILPMLTEGMQLQDFLLWMIVWLTIWGVADVVFVYFMFRGTVLLLEGIDTAVAKLDKFDGSGTLCFC